MSKTFEVEVTYLSSAVCLVTAQSEEQAKTMVEKQQIWDDMYHEQFEYVLEIGEITEYEDN